jgi:pimeloyl-ACP methyl ester carboxylesterase
LFLAVVALLALAGCSSHAGDRAPPRFAKLFEVEPGLGLWLACSGRGRVVLADGGLGVPTEAWAGVRRSVRHVRFCSFDRAGVGRSDVRPCRCGTIERNVQDIHALIRAAALRRPLILAGYSTGGLDALLYARRYPSDVSGLVLVDSPSESAPTPPGPLADGGTRLDFASGLRTLRRARDLGDLPVIVLSHGRQAFSTDAAERSWSRMQRQLAGNSSNTLRIVARSSRHLIQADQPGLVAAVLGAAATSFPRRLQLRCERAFLAARGRCVS